MQHNRGLCRSNGDARDGRRAERSAGAAGRIDGATATRRDEHAGERHRDRRARGVYEHAPIREVASIEPVLEQALYVARRRRGGSAKIDLPFRIPLERARCEILEVRVMAFDEQVVAEIVEVRRRRPSRSRGSSVGS